MKHIPYGYKIENGEIIIDIELANKVDTLFKTYLEGYSLKQSAMLAGIPGYHGSISRMLSNKKYIGALGYPQIISNDVFETVQNKRKEKAKKLGRDNYKSKVKTREINTNFIYSESKKNFDNPFQEAEYKYSLISIEVL